MFGFGLELDSVEYLLGLLIDFLMYLIELEQSYSRDVTIPCLSHFIHDWRDTI